MRQALMVVVLALVCTGCVESVHHVLKRVVDGPVAYRVTVVLEEPAPAGLSQTVRELVSAAPDGTISVWSDDPKTWVAQASLPDLRSLQAEITRWGDSLRRLADRELTGVRLNILEEESTNWVIRPQRVEVGRWVFDVAAPFLSTSDGRQSSVQLRVEVTSGEETPEVVIGKEASPMIIQVIQQGGMSLVFAVAGLIVLVWVMRRTYRKTRGNAKR